MGTTWYTWLEQARDIQPSVEVLRRLGEALQLNVAEVRHMYALAGKALPAIEEVKAETVSESMKRFLNESLQVPAIILGARWDVLAANAFAHELFPGLATLPAEQKNWLYLVLCPPEGREVLEGWEAHARRLIAEFRASVSDSLDNPWVIEFIEFMKRESKEFETWWREHDVRDNSPVLAQLKDKDGQWRSWERLVLRPAEQPRYSIITFSPHPKSQG